MPDDPAPPIDIKEILEALGGLGAAGQQAMEPVTAALNFGTMALLLVITIVNTVPAEQHAENWQRAADLIDRLNPQQRGTTP